MSEAPVWVVAGPPGAGKSTVATILVATLEPAPHLTVDNRLTAARPLRDQIAGLAAQTQGG